MKTKPLSSRIYHLGSTSSMTMMELLVIIGILAVLVVAFFALFNPMQQIGKSWDSKRKKELDTLRKVLEDYYNDKNRFPLATEICYDATVKNPNPRIDTFGKQACSCNICGKQSPKRDLTPYINTLACDPQFPQKKYLYDFDCANNGDSPQWFRIYTSLSNKSDPVIAALGCQTGCGPSSNAYFDYGFPSTNERLEEGMKCKYFSPLYYIRKGICNICGTYSECLVLDPNIDYYLDAGSPTVPGCTKKCVKD